MATEMDDLPQSEGLMAFLLRENDEPEILGAPYFQTKMSPLPYLVGQVLG
jgi:hypothetical protein